MHLYYYFLVPIKDKYIDIISDPSLTSIRMNKSYFNSLLEYTSNPDECSYFAFTGIDNVCKSFDTNKLQTHTSIEKIHDKNDYMYTILKSLTFESTSVDKYLAIATEYPLVVVKPEKKKLYIYQAKSCSDVFNNCILHFYQFLKLTKPTNEFKTLSSLLKCMENKYVLGVETSARFALCCINNIVVENPSRKIFVLKHKCKRPLQVTAKFDCCLNEAVTRLLT